MEITDLRERECALARAAQEDELTGLANRRQFDQHLRLAIARARRQRRPLAVLFIDVDGLKAINDRFGHTIGDRVLREVARRLAGAIREADPIARVDAPVAAVARRGGDEFAIALGDLPEDPDDAVAAAVRRIDAGVAGELAIDGDRIPIAISTGLALFPEDGTSADELISAASIAMLRDRRERRK
jgi:diguanylate cyclase (GGDEF)-like protein